jgi:hypothetical protein
MKHLSGSKKVLAVLGAGLLVVVASGTAFARQAREAHDSRPAVEDQHKVKDRHGQPPVPVFTSPLPTPKPTESHEGDDHNGNVNSNDNTNDGHGGNEHHG